MAACVQRILTLQQALPLCPWLTRAHEEHRDTAGLAWAPLNDTPCWAWHGWTDPSGYAKMRHGEQADALVHRVTWMTLRGALPRHLYLDHLCRYRNCVNPWHLQPVVHTVNVQRGARATDMCRQGLHRMEPGNVLVRVRNGLTRYECKACTDARRDRWRQGR